MGHNTRGTRKHRPGRPMGRRELLRHAGWLGAATFAAPHVWIPNPLVAQTSARGSLKHLLYIRLSGGFRFQVAFNAQVAEQFNPFGRAQNVASGAEWGVGALLGRSGFLEGERGEPMRALGMRPVPAFADQISVIPCVDHEPLAASADGGHYTALERWWTGYVDGPTGFFTMINYGLRERMASAAADGRVILPAFVLGGSGMGRGSGLYAAYRPPILSGRGFDQFSAQSGEAMPEWARQLVTDTDVRMRDRQHQALRNMVDGFIETRKATEAYSEIFDSDVLKIDNRSDVAVDGVSNRQLEQVFGTGSSAYQVRLALRLFHFGAPAAYLDQGGYDLHSGEEGSLPGRLEDVNRMLSGLEAILKRMDHPDGGRYWDHTLVVLGSEFSRTARGQRFNSARGSDHSGDLATRWMSMPFMGGALAQPGGQLGETRASDLQARGRVYAYRAVLKTLMDGLGCDHQDFFPADPPFEGLLR